MNKKKSLKSIQLGPTLKKQLKKEFNCTRQTVHMALTYFSNSKKAKSIRKRSIELLIQEAKKIRV